MIKVFAIFATVIFIGIIFQAPVAKAVDTTTYFEAVFPAQTIPGTGLTIENNVAGDVSEIRTELGVWEDDLGSGVTDGSYIGPIFESSLFEIDYNPYYVNEAITKELRLFNYKQQDPWEAMTLFNITDGGNDQVIFPIAKKRSVLIVSMNVNFTSRMILSGATEFYVKIPVASSCVDFSIFRPSLSFFQIDNPDYERIWLEDGYTVYYRTSYNNFNLTESGDIEYQTTYPGTIEKNLGTRNELRVTYERNAPSILQSVTDDMIIGQNMYVHVNAIIEPNTNYLVTFACILQDKPRIFLTEEDLFNNGRESVVNVADMEFAESTVSYAGWIYPFQGVVPAAGGFKYTTATVPFTGPPGFFPFVNETIVMPVDLSFSFIFKNGRGDNGMFGRKIHFDEGDGIVFYRTVQSPKQDDTFVSIMIPFISNDAVVVNLTVTSLGASSSSARFESRLVLGTWNKLNGSLAFTYASPPWWQAPKNMTYTDYILFTIPYKFINPNLANTFKILVTFVKAADVTFMFSTIDNQLINQKLGDDVYRYVDASLIFPTGDSQPSVQMRNRLTYVYRNIVKSPIFTGCYNEKDFTIGYPLNTDIYWEHVLQPREVYDAEIYHYDLFCSVQFTDGLWHELATTPEGYHYATHFFERRIAVGVVDIWVDTTSNESTKQVAWYDESLNEWELAAQSLRRLDFLGTIYHTIKGVLSLLWNGLKEFIGVIIGVFKKIWDTLVGIGEFVYSILTSFVGWIATIIGDIADAAAEVLSIFIYVVAIVIFMYIVGWSGKLLYAARVRE